jgi:Uncharacterised nucleotidyltransferase
MDRMERRSPFTPEQELLLCCARSRFSDPYSERVKHLSGNDIDWKTVIDLSETHKLTQLLYQNLKTCCPEIVPAEVMRQLQEIYNTQVQYILFLTAELISLVKDFSAAGIPVVPYKGPVLATQVYGNLALRPFVDLDILVWLDDIPRAKALLLEKGYRITWPELPLSGALEKVHFRTKYNYTFVHPDRQVTLELHWGVTPNYFSFPSSVEWLWQDLETIRLAGTDLLAFPIEKLLLILCVHGGNHLWDRVSWICDISELVSHYAALDWGMLFGQAADFGVHRLLLTGLSLAHDLLDAPLPEEVRSKIEADAQVQWLSHNMIERFASFRWSHSGFLDIPLYHLRARERFRDKANYCLQMTTPSVKDWSFVPLPERLGFLYYLIRPVRLVVEYGVNPLLKR